MPNTQYLRTTQQQLRTDEDALLREPEAAAFLGFTPRTLQAWRQRGQGPVFVRISARAIRYRKKDLNRWAEDLLRSSTSDPGTQSRGTA